MSIPHTIYVAGPCFTSAELAFNRMLAAELQSYGHRVNLPQDFVDPKGDIKVQCLDRMSDCTLMVAILDGPDVDSGTAYEVGYWQANWPQAPVIAYRSDIRRGGDTDKNVNAMLSDIPSYPMLGELLNAINKL